MKFLIMFIFLVFSISWARAEAVVKLGLLLFPPDVAMDHETNECVGRNVSITRELLAEYDINVQVICSSPLRIYPMLLKGDVDFTINIKSTEILSSHVTFSEIPFRKIKLNLYTHIKPQQSKSISAVTGYNYQGYRQKIRQQGFEFIDLPSTVSALQLFLKGKTDYLISYDSPVQNYLSIKNLNLNNNVLITPLVDIDTYYAVAQISPYHDILMQVFSAFAARNQVQYLASAFP